MLAGPEPVCDVPVGGRVAELDGRRHAEGCETWQVFLGEELGVLDPVPEPERPPDVLGGFERVESVAVRPISDRVHRNRESCVRAPDDDLGELGAARNLDPASVEEPGRL